MNACRPHQHRRSTPAGALQPHHHSLCEWLVQLILYTACMRGLHYRSFCHSGTHQTHFKPRSRYPQICFTAKCRRFCALPVRPWLLAFWRDSCTKNSVKHYLPNATFAQCITISNISWLMLEYSPCIIFSLRYYVRNVIQLIGAWRCKMSRFVFYFFRWLLSFLLAVLVRRVVGGFLRQLFR